jgi:membrane-associated phospholipid phosphatase
MNAALPILVLVSFGLGGAAALVVSRSPFRALATETPNGIAAIIAARAAARRDGVKAWLAATRHRTTASSLALCAGVAVFVVGWLAAGVIALLVRGNASVADLDSGVAHWGYDHASSLSLKAFEIISLLGNSVVVGGLAFVLAVLEWWRRHNAFIVLFIAAVVIGDGVITIGAKLAMDRARPALNPVAETLGPSFPSGHASLAAAFFAAAALLLSQRGGRTMTAVAGGIAVMAAVAVALSRVLLDVHWLTDVVAGLAVGWGWFAFCVLAFDGSLRRTKVVEAHD